MAGGGFWGGGFIYINVSGMEAMDVKVRQLATFGESITSLEEPFTQIGEDLLADFGQNMASEGGLFAGGWAPLAPSTIRDRERKGFGAGPILWRTGRLGKSLIEKGNPDNIFEVTPTTLRVGTRVPYAGYHQSGSKKMRVAKVNTLMVDVPREKRFTMTKVLPQRKLVGLTWQRRQMIVRRIGDWVRLQLHATGLG